MRPSASAIVAGAILAVVAVRGARSTVRTVVLRWCAAARRHATAAYIYIRESKRVAGHSGAQCVRCS